MPNIIEQQDLLKGLPDARLMMLLQNPVADIPPFLVAAEAQRRQAIRQQFSASAPNESVVDTLTKQLANVPQNIQAPAGVPVSVPPTPPMQGVAALQAQQAIQNAAQQAVAPQMMRGGGMVRRYQFGGVIRPPAQVMPYVQSASTFAPSVSEFSEFGPMPEPPTMEDIIRENIETDPIRRRRIEEKRREEEAAESEEGFLRGVALPDVPVGFPPPPPPKPRPRPADLVQQAGETEDEFRARLEALYATQGPSDWEKAQKWFAMSEQFLDPSKTTMQSIAGAGRVFAQSAAEQAQAQRLSDIAREKAMLEYDMALAEQRAQAESERAMREYEAQQKMLERGTPSADAALSAITRSMIEIDERIAKLSEFDIGGANAPEIENLRRAKEQLNLQLLTIMRRGGFVDNSIVSEEELRALGM